MTVVLRPEMDRQSPLTPNMAPAGEGPAGRGVIVKPSKRQAWRSKLDLAGRQDLGGKAEVRPLLLRHSLSGLAEVLPELRPIV